MFKTSFFLFIFLIPLSFAFGEEMDAYLLPDEDKAFQDDEIVLDENETLDLEPVTVPETTQTIDGKEIELTQEIEFIANDEPVVTIENTAEPNLAVKIPDNTVLSGPSSWNGEITPPKTVSTSGTIEGNFLTPTSSILVGSPDVVLVFDKPVTLVLNGTTGTIAYKLSGESDWNIISGCTGTFENPDNPPEPGECSIGDGTNTKVLTYHFTEFTGLSSPAPSTPSTPSTSSSGGHGNTGVGSPRIFGSSGGSSGGGYYPPSQTGPISFPSWFDNVSDWYREGKISAKEFLWAYQWIIENVL